MYKKLITVTLTLSLPLFAHAWTPPAQTPTSGNVSAPVNVGSSYQHKTGDFQVGVLGVDGGALVGTVLGVGTAAPLGALHVRQTSNFPILDPVIMLEAANSPANLKRVGLTIVGGSTYLISYKDNGGMNSPVPLTINNTDGKVKIGGAGNSTINYALQVGESGDGKAIGSNAFFYMSDANLKKNIETASDSLSKILQLRGVTFNWKSTDKADVGVVAQEVEKVYPEVVNTGSDGIKAVEYGHLVGPLIEAIKSQQKQIEDLKARVAALEASK